MSTTGTLIVGAAPAESGMVHYAQLIRRAGRVIAADGGVVTCLAAGRTPDICVGDFDSTPPEALRRATEAGAEVLRYPVAKDVSDLDLAVDAARARGWEPLVVCAAFTGRLDHTLAALGTLVSAADLGARADEPGWEAIALDSTVRPGCDLALQEGDVVSVLAFGGPATVSAIGFVYPMHRLELMPMSSHGLSNAVSDGTQQVTVHRGSALVVVNRTADAFALQCAPAITDTL